MTDITDYKTYQITYETCASVSKLILYRMTSKETPKKVYRASSSSIDLSSCRLCKAVGDTSHRKNIFKPSNRHLLQTAEQICGHPIAYEANLPHLICRPCKRRLKNIMDFQKVILNTEQSFRRSESGEIRFKRCVDVSPSTSQPPRSRLSTSAARTARPSAKTSLSFDSCQESSQNIEVSIHYLYCDFISCFELNYYFSIFFCRVYTCEFIRANYVKLLTEKFACKNI